MTRVVESDRKSNSLGEEVPYPPSWVDRFTDWVERRSWPSWTSYLALGIGLLIIQAVVVWVEGALPLGRINAAQAYLSAAIAFMLVLIHYLDSSASGALESMRPVLSANPKEYALLHYKLTTLPSRPTLLASLILLGLVFLTETISEPYMLQSLSTFTISANILRFVYFLSWWMLGVFLYHTIHQLTMINLTYTRYTRVDLLRTRPLYAFSKIAALTAGSVAVLGNGWLLVNPWIDISDPLVFMPIVILLLIALITFLWPQLGIHSLQVNEKERLLDEANLRLESLISELHRRVDDGEMENMMALNMTMASVEMELKTIRNTPTWPWEPEVIRVLITALALPLGLWLIQLILSRFITP